MIPIEAINNAAKMYGYDDYGITMFHLHIELAQSITPTERLLRFRDLKSTDFGKKIRHQSWRVELGQADPFISERNRFEGVLTTLLDNGDHEIVISLDGGKVLIGVAKYEWVIVDDA